jgi:signal transduction histidine kinase
MTPTKTVALSFLAAALVVLLSWQTFFSQVNDIGYDFIMRLAGTVEPSADILIVAIDEESLDRVGGWPWPRSVLAELLVEVLGGSPAAVGFDVLLDDPTEANDDSAMAAVLERSIGVVLAARMDDVDSVTRWRLPLDIFRAPGTALGHVHADPDLDGVLRRIVTAKHADGLLVGAFAVEVLKAAGRLPAGFEEDLGGAVRIVPEELGVRFIGDRGAFDAVPAWQVLEGAVPASLFAGRIVLVGATAEGLGDDWMTPFSLAGRRMSGIEVHANAIDTILSGRVIHPVPDVVVLLLVAVMILALVGLEARFEGVRFFAAGVLVMPLVVALSWALMALGHWWLPFPSLMLGVVLVVPALGGRKLLKVNRDLDSKLERMSTWTAGKQRDGVPGGLSEEIGALADSEARDEWLRAIEAYDERQRGLEAERAEAAARHRDAPRKLDAVEFFNQEMARLVSFNDAVLGGIGDVIIVADPAGTVVYQNPAAQRLAGYREKPPRLWQYLDRLVRHAAQAPDRPAPARTMMAAFARTFAIADPIVFPGLTERVDAAAGPPRHFTLTLSGIADIAVLASLHDVTAERELDQAKNDTVALVSHELRTPLTSIRGFADMLETYDLVDAKGRRFLSSIVSESQRLDRLIQSFLDIAAIESGRQKLDIVDVDPASMIDELVENHRALAGEKGIAIRADASPGPGISVRADRTLLYQAVSNLISNAIKYSPAGATVTVEAATSPEGLGFKVADEGHGIPPEDLERVFEKFYRRSNRETRDESGFGLGLAFVQLVASHHGGAVEVQSAAGRGSTFVLRIPLEIREDE